MGGINVYFHAFLTSALEWWEGKLTPLLLFPYPRRKHRYPLNRRLSGPQSRSERSGKDRILSLSGFESRAVHCIDSDNMRTCYNHLLSNVNSNCNYYALCSKSLRYLGSPNLHSVPLTLYGEQAVGKRYRTSPDRMNFVSETFSSELFFVFCRKS